MSPTLGLPDRLRRDAAAVFLEAFAEELTPALGTGARAQAYVAQALSPPQMIHLSHKDGFIGLVGLHWQGHGVFQTNARAILRHYPWWSVPRRIRHLNTFDRSVAPGEVMIEGFCIARAVRGQGHGTALLRAALARAASLGAERVSLDVAAGNARAYGFYRDRGFDDAPPLGRAGSVTLGLTLGEHTRHPTQ